MELIEGVLDAILAESGKISAGAVIGLILTITLFASIRGFVSNYKLGDFRREGILVLPIVLLFGSAVYGYVIQSTATDFRIQKMDQIKWVEIGAPSEWVLSCQQGLAIAGGRGTSLVSADHAISFCLYDSYYRDSLKTSGRIQLASFAAGWIILIGWVLYNLWRLARKGNGKSLPERTKEALAALVASPGQFSFLTYRQFATRFRLPFPTVARQSVLEAASRLTTAEVGLDLTFLLLSGETGFPSVIDGRAAKPPTDEQKQRARTAAQVLIDKFALPTTVNPYAVVGAPRGI